MRRHVSSIFGHLRNSAGFSLIELMVSVTVMTLVVGTVITQFSGFDAGIVTKARAYDAAQAVRSAQAFATQIRATSTADIVFDTKYLARFTKGSGEMLIMRQMGTDEARAVEYRELTAGYVVKELCVVYANGSDHRATTNDQFLDIAFQRPEVTAYVTPSWITVSSPVVRSYVGITGADPSIIHWVEVDAPGAISIVETVPTNCT